MQYVINVRQEGSGDDFAVSIEFQIYCVYSELEKALHQMT